MEEENVIEEVCTNCMMSIGIVWDTKELGYQIFCPVCGNILMLCEACQYRNGVYAHDCDKKDGKCRFSRKPDWRWAKDE